MDVRSGFQRNYFIFVNEDTGYEAGQKPSGHIKVEVRDGRGRLHAAVQNLRPGNGRFDYALYLLRAGSLPKTLVYAGNFGLRPGNADIEWIFDPADVGRSGVPIEGFDVFAVVAESTGHENSLACPLAAYRNKRVDWRNDFRMFRMVKKPAQAEIKPVPKIEAKPETIPGIKPEIKPEAMPGIEPEAKPEIKPEAKPEEKPETKPEIKPEAMPGIEPEAMWLPESIPEQKTAPEPEVMPEMGAEPVKAGDQPQAYQEAQAPAGDQSQAYQEAPASADDQPQIYQYPADQQTAQFYGTDPQQQYGQGLIYQFAQPRPYIPYPVYQEQPLNTYDPYQTYAQQPQTYDPHQAYPQQPVQPGGTFQQIGDTQEQEYPEALQQPEAPVNIQAEQPLAEPDQLQPEESAQELPQRDQKTEEQVRKAEDRELSAKIGNLVQMPQGNAQMPQDNVKTPQESAQMPRENTQQPQAAEAEQEQTASQSGYQYAAGPGNLNTGCLYLNGNICGEFLNTTGGTASPCDSCKANRGEPTGQIRPAGDLSRLRTIMDLNFEGSDPFHSKRSDYEWWKITNPVNLNNILYQNNIRSPLMFNPAVMLAHYKYHHLIVGIFTRKDGQKYVVCGVPGMHMVDRKPFGDLSKWVQADGGRSRYGAFGYWLVYINPDDGKILNLNQE